MLGEDKIALSKETMVFLKGRVKGCFLCKWILKDFRRNGKLTDYPPYGEGGSGIFPVKSKLRHIELEMSLLPGFLGGGGAPAQGPYREEKGESNERYVGEKDQ